MQFTDGPEIELPKGDVTEGVVRVGDTVRRPRQEQSEFVPAYLPHLEAVGFRGAPRFLGVDDRGRDVLDFVPGDVPGAPPEDWACTDEVVAVIGTLVRTLHDASQGWQPPPELVWFGKDRVVPGMPPELAALPGPPELVAHCDVTPQNVVFRDGRPVALVDFDLARPTRRVADLLTTAMWWVPLQHPDDRAPAQRDVDVPARFRLLLDAYGLPGPERDELLELADPMWRRSWLSMRHNAETRGGGWARMWDEGVGDLIERRRAWFAGERAALASRP
ncbi:MAG TPA: phosphotransferase [Mycobacteriales bacterium]|nr:phosphotransferase [Mycobacteriales bacterium]